MSAQPTCGTFGACHEKIWAAYFLKVIGPLSSGFGTLRKTPPSLIDDAHKGIGDFKCEIAARMDHDGSTIRWCRVDRPRDHPEPDRGWGILYAVGVSQAVQRGAPPYIRR